jgi:DNA-binding transcriptional regulator LsrR (DeoR family)
MMTRLAPDEELRLLCKVSMLHYDENLTQEEVSARLQLSRARVSRLLSAARQRGIVQITVNPPSGIHANLELQLEKQFNLSEVVVVDTAEGGSADSVARSLGIAAADYLRHSIQAEDVIGISWGKTLSSMVSALAPDRLPNLQVVQLIGGLGAPESEAHATDLCRRFGQKLGCHVTLLPAPGIVSSLAAKNALLSDHHIARTIDRFSSLSMAFVGIGAPTPHSVLIRDGTIISQSELDLLLQKGAVGDIALRFFNKHGQLIDSEIDHRVIGISLEQLQNISRVVGVAGGKEKTSTILGALRGKLINVLITDHLTARALFRDT